MTPVLWLQRAVSCVTREASELLWVTASEFETLGLTALFTDELAQRRQTLLRWVLWWQN